MSTTNVVSILVGVAVAVLLMARQLRAQPVNANYRLPFILGIIGVVELTGYFGSLASSSILLYLAITYTVQRLILVARAQRIGAGDGHAESLT